MKKMIFAMLIGVSLSAKVSVVQIDNSSGVDICLNSNGRTIKVQDGEAKRIALELVQVDSKASGLFQDVILNRIPKIPDRALKIIIQDKVFYLWVDARGVVVAREKQPDVPYGAALSQAALKLSPQEQAKLIACVLLVSQDGVQVTKR